MVRKCCAENCTETDLTLLAHRFPKGDEMATKWQNALNLNSIYLDVLKSNYVVCTKHFSPNAYRNAISNSLNTTAVPASYVFDDNERIRTTKVKEKASNVLKRCHKSTGSLQTLRIAQIDSLQPIKKQKIDLEYFQAANDVKVIEHSEEESAEKTEAVIQVTEDYVELPFEIYNKNENNQSAPAIEQVSQSVQTEITQNDREVQTDEVNEEPKALPTADSKDDKLIKLLYPEFGGMTKMELVKLIVEKNQKIKSLEEEKKVLEDAMRKLI